MVTLTSLPALSLQHTEVELYSGRRRRRIIHSVDVRLFVVKNYSKSVTFDLMTLKVVSESRVTWATSMPILVFLGLTVLDLVPMYATGRH